MRTSRLVVHKTRRCLPRTGLWRVLCAQKSATWEAAAWMPTTSSPARSTRCGEHSRSNVLNVELRLGSPAASRRARASTTHTRPVESVPTVKPRPKPRARLIATRTARFTHTSPGPEHSFAYISMHHYKRQRETPPQGCVKGLRRHPRGSQRGIYIRS